MASRPSSSGVNKCAPITRRGPSSKVVAVVDVNDDPVTDEEVIFIYRWLDSLEFSKSRKTSANRDFADGVMMSELIALYIPKIINSTYCIPTYAISRKISNWEHLNKKVFSRIRLQLTPEIIKELATAKAGMIERVLKKLQPILFLGSKAVIAPSRKLENIKARFLDIEKSYLKKDNKTTGAEENGGLTRPDLMTSRSESGCARARTPSRGRGCVGATAPPPTASPELELKVIKTPNSITATSKRPTSKSSTANEIPTCLGDNYEILTRPSTGKSSNESAPSPSDLLAQVRERLDKENGNYEVDNNENHASSKQRGFPSRSSWLPVVQGEADAQPAEAKQKNLDNSQGDLSVLAIESEDCSGNGNTQQKTKDEEEADEEIYCDQTGYDEDTEDAADDYDDEEESDKANQLERLPTNNRSSSSAEGGQRINRKVKRVVKYEYREEYILNGMANFLPNKAQLKNLRKNYMTPANKDTNCRGYGFV